MAHYDEDYFYPDEIDDIAKDPNGKFDYWAWISGIIITIIIIAFYVLS